MIRILIADDHAILRRGLEGILLQQLEGAVCGEAENGEQLLELVRREEWDLVILDVRMPGRSGLDVLEDLKKLRPKLPVLVLSMLPEDVLGKRALKAGASGYLNKESAPGQLIGAVRKILAGGLYISPPLADRLALDSRPGAPGRPLHETLSNREFEILRLIALGKTVSQIAAELRLSVPTVSTHRAHILEKMYMTTTAEVIRYAVRNRIVD
jgi:DNA-binding NarL/FixJ family response regulator